MPYGSKLHIPPTNYHLLATQQEPYKKTFLRVFWGKSQENGPLAEKWQKRKSKRTRQKITREEIGKGNQMTALRFQTPLASFWGVQAWTFSKVMYNSAMHRNVLTVLGSLWFLSITFIYSSVTFYFSLWKQGLYTLKQLHTQRTLLPHTDLNQAWI